MKKIINVLVVLIISIPMFAQTEYYYFKGQRIPLTVNPKKVNIISMAIGPQFAPAVNPNALPAGLEVEAVIPGNPYNMCVIENKTSNIALLHNYLNYIVNPNYNIILPCYYDHNGKELFTTNKIYIELKNSTDFIKLQSVISVYNLLIIRQNKYMPLWYTVSITKQTPYNTIQMANILYELGYFLSVEPEFRFNAKESISWDTYVGEQWGLYNATGQQVRDIIEQSTAKVGMRDYEGEYTTTPGRPNGTWNQYYGYGLVDALKAVQNTPRKRIDY